MKANQKIVLSLLAAGMLSLTGCGGGGGGTTDTTTTTPPPTTPPPATATTVYYGGSGAADIEAVHVANDASAIASHPRLATNPADIITLTGDLSTQTLDKTKQYHISGRVFVATGETLTIPAGTVLFGETGSDYLVVEKGADIIANGTAAEPIIFTSRTALVDPLSADVGQWGGVTILGAAPTNQDDPHYEVDQTEPRFAFGNAVAAAGDAADSSGSLKFVNIYNTGKVLGDNIEINGLSLCGVGNGTVIEDITVINSSDDGIEVWGGTVDMTRLTIINAQDDSLDLDLGYVGNVTDVKIQQVGIAHAGMEISSVGATPMTTPTITNFKISKVAGSDEGGIYIKDDVTAPTFVNGEVLTQGTDAGLNVKKVISAGQDAALSFTDVLFNSPTLVSGSGTTVTDYIGYSVYDANKPTVTLTGDLTTQSLVKTNKYHINGRVYVNAGEVLTIPAGTVLYGTSGSDYLVVEKGGQIIAEGTDAEPIYFTSALDLAIPGSGATGQWGGVTILGAAPTNQNDPHYEVDQTEPRFAFGNAVAGAGDTADNSGSLKNVHILHTGKVIGDNIEINGLSLCGIGNGTTIENIYVGNSSDDGIEIWGGTVNLTNAMIVNAQDDSLDLDLGYSGTVNGVFITQASAAHAGMEISSVGATPMTQAKINNFVIVKDSASDEGGIYIKDDVTAPEFYNGIVKTATADANLNAKKLFTADQNSLLKFKDVKLLKL